MPVVVSIPTARITDWETFHDVFASTLGFPGFCGRNMNAWIDCLSFPDDPNPMTNVKVEPGDTLTLDLGLIEDFRRRCPEQFAAIVDCAAFVNWRRVAAGHAPILLLAFA